MTFLKQTSLGKKWLAQRIFTLERRPNGIWFKPPIWEDNIKLRVWYLSDKTFVFVNLQSLPIFDQTVSGSIKVGLINNRIYLSSHISSSAALIAGLLKLGSTGTCIAKNNDWLFKDPFVKELVAIFRGEKVLSSEFTKYPHVVHPDILKEVLANWTIIDDTSRRKGQLIVKAHLYLSTTARLKRAFDSEEDLLYQLIAFPYKYDLGKWQFKVYFKKVGYRYRLDHVHISIKLNENGGEKCLYILKFLAENVDNTAMRKKLFKWLSSCRNLEIDIGDLGLIHEDKTLEFNDKPKITVQMLRDLYNRISDLK